MIALLDIHFAAKKYLRSAVADRECVITSWVIPIRSKSPRWNSAGTFFREFYRY
jgi:hypothetical protein